jgi:hypothetical protein
VAVGSFDWSAMVADFAKCPPTYSEIDSMTVAAVIVVAAQSLGEFLPDLSADRLAELVLVDVFVVVAQNLAAVAAEADRLAVVSANLSSKTVDSTGLVV